MTSPFFVKRCRFGSNNALISLLTIEFFGGHGGCHHECRCSQKSHTTVEATIKPLADKISIVVVSTINTAEKSLTAWAGNGEAQFSYGVASQFAPMLMGLLCQKLKSVKNISKRSPIRQRLAPCDGTILRHRRFIRCPAFPDTRRCSPWARRAQSMSQRLRFF
jgi:hypothetical protein